MASTHLTIREGNTGILYVNESSHKGYTYIPDYDIDKANELLEEFHSFKNLDNHLIANNYWHDGINWYPTIINTLYNYFFSFVKYRSLIEELIMNNNKISFMNEGNLYNFVSILNGTSLQRTLKGAIFNSMVWYNNSRVIKSNNKKLLFFKYTEDDFRFARVKNCFNEMNIQYIEVICSEKKILINNLIQNGSLYFIGGTYSKNIFKNDYDLSKYDSTNKIVFKSAIKMIEYRISSFIKEYYKHTKLIAGSAVKTLYGIDDTNVVYPLLYACKKNNVKTIGHQHGATYNKKLASYAMKGINKNEYNWFDSLIFWGEYWKTEALKTSDIYLNKKLFVGSPIYHYKYSDSEEETDKYQNILIPYEFLTNTYKVGLFIKRFIDSGYNILFKPRVDEDLSKQLESYCLTDNYLNSIKIVNQITPDVMKSIKIIAGTMSTLVYQLIPYKKIIWVLDTEYSYLQHLVDEGMAHKIRLEDIKQLNKMPFTKTIVDSDFLFCDETLMETLEKHVLN